MNLELTPVMGTILDVPPHNTFQLMCSMTTPADVISEKMFSWKLVRFLEVIVLPNPSSQITTKPVGNGTSISTLRATVDEPGRYEFYCEGRLDIQEDSSHTAIKMTAANVKGKTENLF